MNYLNIQEIADKLYSKILLFYDLLCDISNHSDGTSGR